MTRGCPSCPDGNEWGATGPTGRVCRTCNGSGLARTEPDDDRGVDPGILGVPVPAPLQRDPWADPTDEQILADLAEARGYALQAGMVMIEGGDWAGETTCIAQLVQLVREDMLAAHLKPMAWMTTHGPEAERRSDDDRPLVYGDHHPGRIMPAPNADLDDTMGADQAARFRRDNGLGGER